MKLWACSQPCPQENGSDWHGLAWGGTDAERTRRTAELLPPPGRLTKLKGGRVIRQLCRGHGGSCLIAPALRSLTTLPNRNGVLRHSSTAPVALVWLVEFRATTIR